SPETQPLWNGVRPATFLLQDHASKEEVRTCAITAFMRLRRARQRSATSSSPVTSRTLSRAGSRPWANPRWRFVCFPAPNWRSKPRRGPIGCRLCSSTGAGGPSVTTSAYSGRSTWTIAIEFPDGRIVLLTHLRTGQRATVIQLPARPQANAAEGHEAAAAQREMAFPGRGAAWSAAE